MPELSPTQKLDKAGVIVRKKLNSSKDINETQLLDMVQTQTNFGSPYEYTNLTPVVWSEDNILILSVNKKI